MLSKDKMPQLDRTTQTAKRMKAFSNPSIWRQRTMEADMVVQRSLFHSSSSTEPTDRKDIPSCGCQDRHSWWGFVIQNRQTTTTVHVLRSGIMARKNSPDSSKATHRTKKTSPVKEEDCDSNCVSRRNMNTNVWWYQRNDGRRVDVGSKTAPKHTLGMNLWNGSRRIVQAMRSQIYLIVMLKSVLTSAWNDISINIIQSATSPWISRLEKCVAARGGHFEQLWVSSNKISSFDSFVNSIHLIIQNSW